MHRDISPQPLRIFDAQRLRRSVALPLKLSVKSAVFLRGHGSAAGYFVSLL